MPFEFSTDRDKRMILVTGAGEGSLEDTLGAVKELLALTARYPGYSILSDNRSLTYEPPIKDVVQIARELFEHRSMFKRSMAVVVKPGIQEALGRVFAAMGNVFGMQVDVFTDVNEAIEWLTSPRRKYDLPVLT